MAGGDLSPRPLNRATWRDLSILGLLLLLAFACLIVTAQVAGRQERQWIIPAAMLSSRDPRLLINFQSVSFEPLDEAITSATPFSRQELLTPAGPPTVRPPLFVSPTHTPTAEPGVPSTEEPPSSTPMPSPPTSTPRPTNTPAPTNTPSPTSRPTATPTVRPTATPTPRPTATPTATPLPTATNTPLPPTATPTPLPTPEPTLPPHPPPPPPPPTRPPLP